MNKFIKKIFYLFLIANLSTANDYLWPLKIKKELTAVFGEERPGRYHTGIDIRTFGNIGYDLIAIDDGYISRIRTSSKGYGKTIYLKLNNGFTAVYAHLDHFTLELDNLTHALHENYGKYTIDHKLEPNEYPIKKGDLIGYSGDTGGISGPHLHFEIRNKNGQPVNPFLYSFDLPDSIPPEPKYLAIIPLDDNAEVDGFKEQKIYPLKKINNNKYILVDTVYAFGNIGLAVNAIDKINDQYFNFGIYSMNLLLDASFIYSMQYDEINWENASKLYTEKNYSLARSGYGKFYHLFSSHNNHKLPFINSKSQPGYFFNKGIIHDAIIDIKDFGNNEVEIFAYFISDTIPNYNYDVEFKNNDCKITFANKDYVKPAFYLTGPNNNDPIYPANYIDSGNNVFIVKDIINPFNVLRVSAKNTSGILSVPSFHMKNNVNFENITGKYLIKHYEHGIIMSFEENIFSGLEAYLVFNRKGQLTTHNLNRDSKLTLSSNLLSPMLLDSVSEIKVFYQSVNPYEISSMDLSGGITYPDSSFNINLLDNQINLVGDKSTFYDTTFVWAQKVNTSNPAEGDIIAGPFYILPYLIPYNKNIDLKIKINKIHSTNNLGIYSYNQKKHTWHFYPSVLSLDSNYISTSISSGEIFAVINEKNPPILSNFIPHIGATYYSNDLKVISFIVKDTFSGIDGESDIIVKIDNKPVIFEYNSYQNKVRYPLKYNLDKGKHSLFIQAYDKIGNKSIIKGDFYIK